MHTPKQRLIFWYLNTFITLVAFICLLLSFGLHFRMHKYVIDDSTEQVDAVAQEFTVYFLDRGTLLDTQLVKVGDSATPPNTDSLVNGDLVFDTWNGMYVDVTSDRVVDVKWKLPNIAEDTSFITYSNPIDYNYNWVYIENSDGSLAESALSTQSFRVVPYGGVRIDSVMLNDEELLLTDGYYTSTGEGEITISTSGLQPTDKPYDIKGSSVIVADDIDVYRVAVDSVNYTLKDVDGILDWVEGSDWIDLSSVQDIQDSWGTQLIPSNNLYLPLSLCTPQSNIRVYLGDGLTNFNIPYSSLVVEDNLEVPTMLVDTVTMHHDSSFPCYNITYKVKLPDNDRLFKASVFNGDSGLIYSDTTLSSLEPDENGYFSFTLYNVVNDWEISDDSNYSILIESSYAEDYYKSITFNQ